MTSVRGSNCQTKIIEHTKIKLPFREDMAKATLEGRKNCTTRGSKKGSIGDQFDVEAEFEVVRPIDPEEKFRTERGTFELFAVRCLPLWYVAKHLYRMEGFRRMGEFIQVWDELYEANPFWSDIERMVWTHFYFPAGTCDYAPEDMQVSARRVA